MLRVNTVKRMSQIVTVGCFENEFGYNPQAVAVNSLEHCTR